jgi:hypothetical protein
MPTNRGQWTPKTKTRRAPPGESPPDPDFNTIMKRLIGLEPPVAGTIGGREAIPVSVGMPEAIGFGGVAGVAKKALANPKAFIASIRALVTGGKTEQAWEKVNQLRHASVELGRRALSTGARQTKQAATQAKNLSAKAEKLREVTKKAETVVRGGGKVAKVGKKAKPIAPSAKRPPPAPPTPTAPVSPIPRQGRLTRAGRYVIKHPGKTAGGLLTGVLGVPWAASSTYRFIQGVRGYPEADLAADISKWIGTRRGGPDPVEAAKTAEAVKAAGDMRVAMEGLKHLGRAQITRRRLAETTARTAASRYEEIALNMRLQALERLEKGLIEHRTANPNASMDAAVRAVAGRPLMVSEMTNPVDDDQAAVAELIQAQARNLLSTGPATPGAAQAVLTSPSQSEPPVMEE